MTNTPKKKQSPSSSSSRRRSARKRPAAGLADHKIGLMMGLLVIAVLVMLALSIGLQRVGGSEPVWVKFPSATQGSLTSEAVRDSLKARLGPSTGMRVYLMWRMQGGKPQNAVGAYRFDPSSTALMAARRLAKGRQTPVTFTFNNLRTMKQLAERAEGALDMSSAEFLDACARNLTPLGFSREQWPAAFVPDTYEFYYTVNPDTLVSRLVKSRNRFWTAERTMKAERLGLTPAGVATIASIVEEETAKADERPRVARLYLNRLKRDMPLQADPTVKFAVGDFSIRRITGSMLQTPSPYNTYRRRGLPPGPIRIAEKQTMLDVLDAPAHDFIYMCAREDFSGYHNFTTTYEAHQQNARRYQAALNARNIH